LQLGDGLAEEHWTTAARVIAETKRPTNRFPYLQSGFFFL
jgi:hypothetical protein